MLAVVTLPHGQITTLSGEATWSRGLSHHRITLVARLGRALVAAHQAASSLRVQQLLMRLRVAARAPTTLPHPTLREGLGVSLGSPFPTVHSPSPPSRSLPCSAWKTPMARDRWRVSLLAPSALCGSPAFAPRVRQVDLGDEGTPPGRASVLSPLVYACWLDWLTSQTRSVRVSVPRRA